VVWEEGRFFKPQTLRRHVICRSCMDRTVHCAGCGVDRKMTLEIFKQVICTDIACHNPLCKKKKARSSAGVYSLDYKWANHDETD
jgi:hypothetical protein